MLHGFLRQTPFGPAVLLYSGDIVETTYSSVECGGSRSVAKKLAYQAVVAGPQHSDLHSWFEPKL
jgi:hypothetical protein